MSRECIDETGNRYTRLLVVGYAGIKNKDAYWECVCDCGTEHIVKGAYLRNGNTKSCGCYSRENLLKYNKARALPRGIAARNNILRGYKEVAKKRGHEWKLTDNEFFELATQDCYYCGVEPTQIRRTKTGDYTYNGIDRIDNNKGYIDANVVPCCGDCNVAKHARTEQEFRNWVIQVYNYYIKEKEDE